jgi:hypothetical protein
MQLLEFIFKDIWHFIGTAILLGMVCQTICYVTVAIVTGLQPRSDE